MYLFDRHTVLLDAKQAPNGRGRLKGEGGYDESDPVRRRPTPVIPALLAEGPSQVELSRLTIHSRTSSPEAIVAARRFASGRQRAFASSCRHGLDNSGTHPAWTNRHATSTCALLSSKKICAPLAQGTAPWRDGQRNESRRRTCSSGAACGRRARRPGSCPVAGCSGGGVITALAGTDRAGQAATAGSPTMGSSLNGAIVSSVI